MSYWNTIYSHFDPVAFEIFGFRIHWYGIAYAFALLLALYVARYWCKRDRRFDLDIATLDFYFIWAEVGVILGARIGYVLIYDPMAVEYLKAPWQIFNPFDRNGEFIGIRGMSYHGAVAGFLIASYLFARRKKKSFLMLMDIIALSVPLAYVFGRIGNFLNQELFGRVVGDSPLGRSVGILVDGQLRYPSQLIEAFLEGVVVYLLVLFVRARTSLRGALIATYGIGYSLARFVAEYFREPDAQLGSYALGLSMGQILSLVMFVLACVIGGVVYNREGLGSRALGAKNPRAKASVTSPSKSPSTPKSTPKLTASSPSRKKKSHKK